MSRTILTLNQFIILEYKDKQPMPNKHLINIFLSCIFLSTSYASTNSNILIISNNSEFPISLYDSFNHACKFQTEAHTVNIISKERLGELCQGKKDGCDITINSDYTCGYHAEYRFTYNTGSGIQHFSSENNYDVIANAIGHTIFVTNKKNNQPSIDQDKTMM